MPNAIETRINQKQKQLIELLIKTPVIEVVCQKVEIGRTTYYRWRKSNKKFASDCDKAIEEGCLFINDLAESQLITAMKNNNLTAVMYWLNHRHKAYANRLEVSSGLEITKDELTKEQEKNIMRALKLASLVINNKGDKNDKSK